MEKKYRVLRSNVKSFKMEAASDGGRDKPVNYDNRLEISYHEILSLSVCPSFEVTMDLEVVRKVSDRYHTSEDEVMTLNMCYSIHVDLPERGRRKREIADILKTKVPSSVFDTMRVMVWNMTQAAGHPYMLPDYDFENPENNRGKYKTEDDEEEVPVANIYDQMTDDYEKEENASDSNDTLSDIIDSDEVLPFGEAFGSQLCELCYKIVYPIYYGFFNPFNYKHAKSKKKYDKAFWEAFSKVLLGSFETECEIRTSSDGLPELVFSYNSYWQKPVSELSFDTAVALFNELLMNMRNSYLYTFILERGDLGKYYFADGGLIPKDEYKEFFGEEEYWTPKEKNLLKRAYNKMKNADLMTFMLNY